MIEEPSSRMFFLKKHRFQVYTGSCNPLSMNCLLPLNVNVASNGQLTWVGCVEFGSPKVSILRLSPDVEFQLKYFFLYITTGAKSALEITCTSNGGLELPHVSKCLWNPVSGLFFLGKPELRQLIFLLNIITISNSCSSELR